VTHFHAIVWIDHAQARIFSFNADDVQQSVLRPDLMHHLNVHRKAGSIGSGKAGPDADFLGSVTESLRDFGEFLIVGPGSAKSELSEHICTREPGLRSKLVGVETMDHPTDGQIVAFARKYFRAADRMRH
jgi:hypothetical protein